MILEQVFCVLALIFTYFEIVFPHEVIRNYTNYSLFELRGFQEEILKIINFIDKIDESAAYELGRNVSHILVAPQFKNRIRKALKETTLEILELYSDYNKVIAAEKKLSFRNKGYSWDGYYDLNDIYKYLEMINTQFRKWTKLVIAGRTFEGREIVGLRISTEVRQPNATQKPKVFIESGIHGREWIVPAATTYFIHSLLNSKNPSLKSLRDRFEWHIFPVVNPDGYQYSFTTDRMWRKSRSTTSKPFCLGVDMNRNFAYNFGIFGSSNNPCNYQVYRGENAFSEIETRSLADYVIKLGKVLSYISVHSYSTAILLPYSDVNKHVDDYERLSKVAKATNDKHDSTTFFEKKMYYSIGTSAEFGKKISGMSMDWAYLLRIPLSFIVELRGNTFLWPEWRITESGKEFTSTMIDLCEAAKRYHYY